MTCRIAHIVKCTDKFWDCFLRVAGQTKQSRAGKKSVVLRLKYFDMTPAYFDFFRTSYVCTAHNTVHCIGIRKTSSSALHGQWHPQDFPPPEHSHYLPSGGSQSCFPRNWKIRKTPVSLTISRLFWNGNASWTVAGKVHLLEGTQICNQLSESQTIFRLFKTNSD